MYHANLLADLREIVGPDHVIVEAQALRQGSKDFYWFSPLLKPILDDKQADVIVRPGSLDELIRVIRLAYAQGVPITPRGAGTGNYGQGVPMQGGILLNLRRLDAILNMTQESAQVQAGTLLSTLLSVMEQQARSLGGELRFFPSTLQTPGRIDRLLRIHRHLGSQSPHPLSG